MLSCPRCGENANYRPKGRRVFAVTNIREPDAYYRCGVQVAHDIQSGPIHCGDRATLIADPVGSDQDNMVAAACDSHAHVLKKLEAKT